MKTSPRIPRWRRKLWFAALALAGFTVLGFFVLPPIVKTQLEKQASAALGRTVTVGRVRINPYVLSLTIEDLDIRLKEGPGSFLGWNRLYVNFDALASLGGTWTLSEIELEGFHVAATRQPDGSLNFSDLLTRLALPGFAPAASAQPAAPVSLPRIRIGNLRVIKARADFADQSRAKPFTTVLGPLTFSLTEFRTAPGTSDAPYHFAAMTESGEKLDWSGTLGIEPLRSRGNLVLEAIALPKYAPYVGDLLKAEIQEGKLTFRGHYDLNLSASGRLMKLTDGAMQLRGFKLADAPGGAVAVDLPELDVTGINADALALKATVATVSVNGGQARVQREKEGSINLLTMLGPANPPAGPVTPAKLPEFLVSEVTVKNFKVDVTDLAAPRPAQLGLSGLQVSLKNVTLAEGAVMPLEFSLNWAPEGTVKAAGTVTLKPQLKADLKAEVAGLALLPLSPYLEQFINARITQGVVSTSGSAQVALVDGVPAGSYAGDVTVEKFGLVDGVHNEELAGFGTLTLKELRAATTPKLNVTLAGVNVTAPYARVIVSAYPRQTSGAVLIPPDAVNIFTVFKGGLPGTAEVAPAGAPVAPAAAAPLPDIKVGGIVIADGDFSLTDRSVEPNVHLTIDKFGGTIGSISSDNLARADVNLTALIGGIAPFTIAGKLDPLGAKPYIELELELKNMEMLPLSPYVGKYAGYELARGKLNTSLKATLDGKQLDATDLITLNQFTLGAKVESPDATHLPVRLGVALLKDSAGQIVIDVPVSGNIDDPEVRISKAVLRVIGNLLTKAATSPFSLLGAMLGGAGPELAFQEFAPGVAALQDAERKKLETIVQVLNNRPTLNLALEGHYDQAADTYMLKRLKLAAVVRRAVWENRRTVNPNIPPPEETEVTPEEGVAVIQKMFNEKFPPGTEFGTPLPPRPEVAGPPPEPPPGFFKRVVNTITFKEQREKKSAEQAATDLKEKYEQALVVAKQAGLPLEEMTGRLAETMPVTDDDLRALATARAERVRDYFLTEGKIAADRLFLSQATDATKANQGPRVFLSPQ